MDIKYISLFILVRFTFIMLIPLYALILRKNIFYFYTIFLQHKVVMTLPGCADRLNCEQRHSHSFQKKNSFALNLFQRKNFSICGLFYSVCAKAKPSTCRISVQAAIKTVAAAWHVVAGAGLTDPACTGGMWAIVAGMPSAGKRRNGVVFPYLE